MKNSIENEDYSFYLKEIGEKLYNTRNERKEKLTSVATSIGVSHSVISKIEHGRYPGLSMLMLLELSRYFNIPPRELLPS